MGAWTVAGERTVYTSDWVSIGLADVTTDDGLRIPEHHVVRVPAGVAGCVVHDPEADAVLLIHRHRFIPDRWAWEVPAGRLEPGELPAEAAVREVLEETGWRITGTPELLASFEPSPGLSDQTFHAFAATGAVHVGPPVDAHEAHEVAWVPVPRAVELITTGEVRESLALVGLLTWLRRAGR